MVLKLNLVGEIKQIIPADGWYALYRQLNGSISYKRVVCWALADHTQGDETYRVVYGLYADGRDEYNAGLFSCEENRDFIKYEYIGNTPPPEASQTQQSG